MIFMNATLKILRLCLFLVVSVYLCAISNLQVANSLVRGFVGAFILFIAMIYLHKKINRNALIKNLRYLLIAGVAIGFNWIFYFKHIIIQR